MWTVDPSAAGQTQAWPLSVVTRVASSFSQPGDRVVLIPAPTASPLPGGDPRAADPAIDAALDAVRRADRTADLVVPPAGAGPRDAASARPPLPYWADVFHASYPATPAADTANSADPAFAVEHHDAAGTTHRVADLVITSIGPDTPLDDHFGLACAALLRIGGILVVLTHSDWTRGRLVDPTGPIVALAQNADLLYLQHIVVVHAPVRDGALVIDTDSPLAEDERRGRHRAAIRGLPAPHRRVHTDLLVFAQPRDHDRVPTTPAVAALGTGVIR